jgi:hypothetical protein
MDATYWIVLVIMAALLVGLAWAALGERRRP